VRHVAAVPERARRSDARLQRLRGAEVIPVGAQSASLHHVSRVAAYGYAGVRAARPAGR
jgi:hypothetical protein